MSVVIVTDSASDIEKQEGQLLEVIPMSITFGKDVYLDGENLSKDQFYEFLIEGDVLPKTSQVSPWQFGEVFEKLVSEGHTVVCVTVAAKFSGTYQSACLAASEYPGKVFVVDSDNAAIGEGILVFRGLELAKQGLSAKEIAEILDQEKKEIHLIALLNTLEYLQKGGRLSKTAAIAGTLLSLKPVVCIDEGEIKVLGKARGSKNGSNLLIKEIDKTAGIDFDRPYTLGYTGLDDSLLKKYVKDSARLWQDQVDELPVARIGATIGTHAGPGAIAVAFFAKEA